MMMTVPRSSGMRCQNGGRGGDGINTSQQRSGTGRSAEAARIGGLCTFGPIENDLQKNRSLAFELEMISIEEMGDRFHARDSTALAVGAAVHVD
ncbi:hypothetical protein [Bradyrhizobium sp. DASA03007]|uniref:hypothetical protein n=1 Tax=unclassified Bradyrhizobium TaxID=2631580 RepID=UPI003F6F8514